MGWLMLIIDGSRSLSGRGEEKKGKGRGDKKETGTGRKWRAGGHLGCCAGIGSCGLEEWMHAAGIAGRHCRQLQQVLSADRLGICSDKYRYLAAKPKITPSQRAGQSHCCTSRTGTSTMLLLLGKERLKPARRWFQLHTLRSYCLQGTLKLDGHLHSCTGCMRLNEG